MDYKQLLQQAIKISGWCIEPSPLLNEIPKEKLDKIFEYNYCEFDNTFLGFILNYKWLDLIVRELKLDHKVTILDFGCNQAVQAWIFKDPEIYDKYIGVDFAIPEEYKLATENSIYFNMLIDDYIKEHKSEIDVNNTIAVFSSVPRYQQPKHIDPMFKNYFIRYPFEDTFCQIGNFKFRYNE